MWWLLLLLLGCRVWFTGGRRRGIGRGRLRGRRRIGRRGRERRESRRKLDGLDKIILVFLVFLIVARRFWRGRAGGIPKLVLETDKTPISTTAGAYWAGWPAREELPGCTSPSCQLGNELVEKESIARPEYGLKGPGRRHKDEGGSGRGEWEVWGWVGLPFLLLQQNL